MNVAKRERSEDPAGTREQLITAAERLLAEHGVSISNRQIGAAAGQANNWVVGYDFGTRTDLVLAVLRRHETDVEQRRLSLLSSLRPKRGLDGWLTCVVRPITDHLDSLPRPTWYARFLAATTTEPSLRPALLDEQLASPSMRAIAEGMSGALKRLRPEVFAERSDMSRHLIVHTLAERERALESKARTPRRSWADAASGLVDALSGLWQAPVRTRR